MPPSIDPVLWSAIGDAARRGEHLCVEELCALLAAHADGMASIETQAAQWIQTLRAHGPKTLGIEALLQEYRLDTPEGIALMCLAEALLRIPDPAAADALIHDLLGPIPWQQHRRHSEDFFVNAASWGLALTGRWLTGTEHPDGDPQGWLQRLATRFGDDVLRKALRQAMRFMAGQFVLGETLETALNNARRDWTRGITHSFDMLGEAALTGADSRRYLDAYRQAILAVGASTLPDTRVRPSVSIKLSALHPRYHAAHAATLHAELIPELHALCALAAAQRVDISIDAEEADRLELSLQLFSVLLDQLQPSQRQHVGLVVQAYNKRALALLQWLHAVARHYTMKINVRLVKGAYWDGEIKRAQQRGLSGYPVFTDKAATDASYLACAQFLLAHREQFFPQFATHNATTIAALIEMAGPDANFELQRLQGMGEALHACVQAQHPALNFRVYAPVGEHRELLPYLVRRLLENGANTSFIHQLFDPHIPVETLARHPLRRLTGKNPASPPTHTLPLPQDIFGAQRKNSPGIDLYNSAERDPLFNAIQHTRIQTTTIDTANHGIVAVYNPADGNCIGNWRPTTSTQLQNAYQQARATQTHWENQGVQARAEILQRCADQFIAHRTELLLMIVQETGRTLENALEEIREAVDFCRYYAALACELFAHATALPGVVGEQNQLWLRPRGVFACISPWNFPLAIFVGQIAAALAAGNAVLAKPAEQSTLTAQFAASLMFRAGVPASVLHVIAGFGETIGAELCALPELDGVVFTGGFATAQAINRQLAQRSGAIIPFIAETAGLNCLIADSSAQPQQLVQDVIHSAFDSAGQRCSALRILLLPNTCASAIETLLIGAMQTLRSGDPLDWSTDIGPVIDADAKQSLRDHIEKFRARGQLLFQCDDTSTTGHFVPPTLIRLRNIHEITGEAFGPILHVAHYDPADIDTLIADINATGFGLTCGIHSRNMPRAQTIAQRIRAGNCYINRDMIGAIVGAQPFGGCGKSGTGPKSGGPNYLLRFASEQTITINTAAIGGDAQLLASTPHSTDNANTLK